jgi:hypothetical protein
VGGLSHYLEEEGLATTHISLIREHTEKIKPPRALWVPFELGRPLGLPNDAAFQKRVLKSALSLLDASAGPILEDFPEDVPAPADLTGWACPINLAKAQEEFEDDEGLPISLIREISFLMPWYDMATHKRGRTTVGVSGMKIQDGAEFLAAFLYDQSTPAPRDDLSLGDAIKLVSEDIKAFYLEAVTAQPGSTCSSQLADWFWRETEAGKLLLDLRAVCLKSSDPSIKLLGTFLIVPRSQEHRSSL